ncbi:MAG: DsrE/DsrF/DrsH-like family protein [Candidatus Caldarchaeum sp.]|nr:DsrE/DsrF/DrsH-like family protein [Candidatus Caldarchaeales archaeon]MDJ0272328.1 DsrE/DsrF/DrsH-like family protein [Candidatus Caldarchaeales archaeon]
MTQATAVKPVEETPQTSKLCIILSKGTLDMAYPAFMLANAAAAMGYEVHIFFTFWGMSVIDKRKIDNLKVSSVGNPALPMPNLLGALPGMTAMVTRMLKNKMAKQRVPTIRELIKTAKEAGVKLHACSTTMDVMGLKKEDFIPEVDDIVGAASFIQMSEGGQVIFI